MKRLIANTYKCVRCGGNYNVRTNYLGLCGDCNDILSPLINDSSCINCKRSNSSMEQNPICYYHGKRKTELTDEEVNFCLNNSDHKL